MHTMLLMAMMMTATPAATEAQCRDEQAQVEDDNSGNMKALMVDVGFWLANSLVAGGFVGCMFLFGGLPFVTLAGWIGLGVASIVGGVLAVMIIFDLLRLGAQQSPQRAYNDCMGSRNRDGLNMRY